MKYKSLLLTLATVVALNGCTGSRQDGIDPEVANYFEATKSHSISSWRKDISTNVYGVAFFANAITAIHLIGVWLDTIVVVDKSESLALGIGAILARDKNCPQLVHTDDYQFIQAMWVGAVNNRQLRSAFVHAKEAQRLAHGGTAAARQLAVHHMLRAVEEKIGLKITGKIAAKFGAKIIVKKLVGFVPVLGGVVAVLINKIWFLDPMQESSETYYLLKAELVCS